MHLMNAKLAATVQYPPTDHCHLFPSRIPTKSVTNRPLDSPGLFDITLVSLSIILSQA